MILIWNINGKSLHIMNDMAQGKNTLENFDAYMKKIDTTYTEDDISMNFVTNHDENSWSGTVKKKWEMLLRLCWLLPTQFPECL